MVVAILRIVVATMRIAVAALVRRLLRLTVVASSPRPHPAGHRRPSRRKLHRFLGCDE